MMSMRFDRFYSIVKKEFIHIKRDKASLIMALMMPIIFTLLFGYAVNTEVDEVKMAVLDMDKSYQSREFIKAFEVTGYFNPSIYLKNSQELTDVITGGKVSTALVIPGGFGQKTLAGERGQTQLIIDGVDPTLAGTALKSGVLTASQYGVELLGKDGISIEQQQRIDMRTKVWFNPKMDSATFTVPGLIGLILQNITVMLTAFSLVREREKGTLELLIVTPVRSSELVLGKMAPYVIIGTIDFLFALFLGTWWFHVPVLGSMLLLIGLGILFVFCSLAIGMLISTIASNQAQAMQMTLLFILPSVLLSGFMFPREAMPLVIQLSGYVVPLTYFLSILRGIILKGASMQYLWKDTLMLTGFSMILLFIASMRFKKHLD
jgi:ABC-2 type transport system permease protein